MVRNLGSPLRADEPQRAKCQGAFDPEAPQFRPAFFARDRSRIKTGDIVTGSVGIFWGIPEPGGSWIILVDAASLANAEPYGDFLTHPRGHYEVWTQWQKTRTAPVTNRFILQAIADHEYEFFPRGRIVYNTATRGFILYADRRLQQIATITAIANEFGLTLGAFVVRSDAHYRS